MDVAKPNKIIEPYWNYFQIETYLSNKLNQDLSFFWDWLIDERETVRNGCLLRFPLTNYLSAEETPDNIKIVLRFMKEEFSEDQMVFWIEW